MNEIVMLLCWFKANAPTVFFIAAVSLVLVIWAARRQSRTEPEPGLDDEISLARVTYSAFHSSLEDRRRFNRYLAVAAILLVLWALMLLDAVLYAAESGVCPVL